ncbi:hypothetical protein [Brevibacillus laterosporus]|uniref:hypothetical protein n=1 Tax=Brevibacillus laterosporus TaxID=1465 RepID=UPI000E6CBF89|nr:hypothetical protein [Brevibacillus laterosporus]AYB38216.1 hypothetical protein D5F52_07990 [Brevibacillus laterosporus]MBM7111849.1 hypothetical protein [Brevibacillus laterosporus]
MKTYTFTTNYATNQKNNIETETKKENNEEAVEKKTSHEKAPETTEAPKAKETAQDEVQATSSKGEVITVENDPVKTFEQIANEVNQSYPKCR